MFLFYKIQACSTLVMTFTYGISAIYIQSHPLCWHVNAKSFESKLLYIIFAFGDGYRSGLYWIHVLHLYVSLFSKDNTRRFLLHSLDKTKDKLWLYYFYDYHWLSYLSWNKEKFNNSKSTSLLCYHLWIILVWWLLVFFCSLKLSHFYLSTFKIMLVMAYRPLSDKIDD